MNRKVFSAEAKVFSAEASETAAEDGRVSVIVHLRKNKSSWAMQLLTAEEVTAFIDELQAAREKGIELIQDFADRRQDESDD